MITAETFEQKVGHEPIDDDLERANCEKAGQFGHYSCGWCSQCDKPHTQCLHGIPASALAKPHAQSRNEPRD